jgi:hypothetical protein
MGGREGGREGRREGEILLCIAGKSVADCNGIRKGRREGGRKAISRGNRLMMVEVVKSTHGKGEREGGKEGRTTNLREGNATGVFVQHVINVRIDLSRELPHNGQCSHIQTDARP